ncbi:MAG: peptidylprolyl isomerase [Oscillospiraceae bacterium]|nr:peptidylprolyl isomerase [Oscillospiraceae bacterium]
MKRLMMLLLVFSLLLCCGCGKDGSNNENPSLNSDSPSQPADKPEESTASTEESAETTVPTEEPGESTTTTEKPQIPVNTTALIVNDHEISFSELDYFYIDAINQYCNQYRNYLSYLLNTGRPLDEQLLDATTGKTWADNFLEMAIHQARNVYALYDAAQAAGYTLPQDQAEAMQALYDSMDDYAREQGYDNTTAYLKAIYGELASEQTYKDYYEITTIASSYYNHHTEETKNSYQPSDLRAFEDGKKYAYNSYSYASFYLSLDSFNEDELKEAAETLASPENNTVEKLNAAIKQMEQNLAPELGDDFTYSQATENKNILYSRVNTIMQEWLRDEARMPGDITAIPYEVTTLGEDGNEIRTLKGYFVVLFQGCNENIMPLANVRHILVAYEGGLYDNATGQITYSATEKETAKNQAEVLLNQWKAGAATENSFAALANEHSDDGDGTTGGLYEDVYPGQMVRNFNAWCFDESRQYGDTALVETEYGYHVMYYAGDSQKNYRDYMIANDMLGEDIEAWQTALNDAATVIEKDTSKINQDIIIEDMPGWES